MPRAGLIGFFAAPALLLANDVAARDLSIPAAPAAQDIAAQAIVIDDPTQPHVVASTHATVPSTMQDAAKAGRAATGAIRVGDAHLRAQIDRQSRAVRWQLWQEITHTGRERELTRLAFGSGEETGETTIVHIERQPERCPPHDAMVTACTTRVHYAFDLPAETVARMARGTAPVPLTYRDTLGRTFHGAIHPAEVAGLTSVVEALQPVPGMAVDNRETAL